MKQFLLLAVFGFACGLATASPSQRCSTTKHGEVITVGSGGFSELTFHITPNLDLATMPLEFIMPEPQGTWYVEAVIGTPDTKRHNAYRYVNRKLC